LGKIHNNWFKHSSDASFDSGLQSLLQKRNYRAVCLYWFILERLSAQFLKKENSQKVELNLKFIAHAFGTYPKGIQNTLKTLSEHIGSISYGCVADVLWISVDNYFELQGISIDKIRLDKIRKDTTVAVHREQKPVKTVTPKMAQYLKICQETLDELNFLSDKNFGFSQTNKNLILAILELGYTKDDIFTVLNNQAAVWCDQKNSKGEDMMIFFNPVTLFKIDKFEKYLDQARNKNAINKT
jgi:uncharacterized phage protein (TIGR02220 family)